VKYQQEIRESLLGLVKRLPEGMQEVVTERYGLGGKEAQTLEEIGRQQGLSRTQVGRLWKEALVWLSQPAHSQELRSLLGRHNQKQYELADELAQAWLRRRGGRNGRR
jgi:DNA-directed RNA polymerase sigma subunit (sigma70/sigma32)